MADLLLTASDTEKMLDIAAQSLKNMKKRGIPMTESKPPKYPARECVLWAIKEGIVKYSISNNTDLDTENLPPRERKDLADAQLKELELAKKRGELISLEDIRDQVERIMVSFKAKTLSIPSKIAPVLITCETVEEIKAIIDTSMRELLTELDRLADEP